MPVPEDQPILWLELLQGDPVEVIFELCVRKRVCKIKEIGESVYDCGKCGF